MDDDLPRKLSPLSRRSFLRLAAGGTGAAMLGGAPGCETAPMPEYPFTLGVASGDPLPDRVMLWTRLAPRPLEGGGMPRERVTAFWEIAHDESFQVIARAGVETSGALALDRLASRGPARDRSAV